jgi:AcrR family transcriptional regulator
LTRSRTLNKERVLETAAALANEQGGLEALTLTRLAAALDVRVPSLYNHITGLDGLRDDLRLRAGRELLAQVRAAANGLSGAAALRAMADANRRFAQQQPGLYPLTIIAPDPTETEALVLADEWLGLLLLVMATVGLQGEEALHAIRGFRALVHGYIALEMAGGYKMDLDRDASYGRIIDTFLAGLNLPAATAPQVN